MTLNLSHEIDPLGRMEKVASVLNEGIDFGPRTTIPNFLSSSGFLPFIKAQYKTLPV